MYSIRAGFDRGDNVKYISHLDLMRTFERALRRSRLPIAYSQGFNPHPQIVFGLPLSVGVTSEAEYADFEFSEDIRTGDFIGRLNAQLPDGLKITDAAVNCSKTNIMASVALAAYSIVIASEDIKIPADVQRIVENIMKMPSIVVKKEGKKGTRDVDIRPLIHSVTVKALNVSGLTDRKKSAFGLDVLLSAGSEANLRPELLVQALRKISGKEMDILSIHRTELYVRKGGRIFKPLAVEALKDN